MNVPSFLKDEKLLTLAAGFAAWVFVQLYPEFSADQQAFANIIFVVFGVIAGIQSLPDLIETLRPHRQSIGEMVGDAIDMFERVSKTDIPDEYEPIIVERVLDAIFPPKVQKVDGEIVALHKRDQPPAVG